MGYFVFFIFLLISLFLLYLLSKNDFVLLREDVSPVEVFDIVVVVLIFSFILGRLFYIFDYETFQLLDPIRFLHFVKLKGFSFLGSFLGIFPAVFWRARKKKKKVMRLFDIFLLSSSPIFYLILVISDYPNNLFLIKVIILIIGLILVGVLFNSFKNYSLRDGSISLLMLIILSLNNFFIQFKNSNKILFETFSFSQTISIIIIFLSVIIVLINQGVIFKKKE